MTTPRPCRASLCQLALAATLLLSLTGCQTAYYQTMEKFGVHKRDILIDRVEESRQTQQETKEQFADALEQFQAVVHTPGGELQEKYDRLKAVLDDSEAHASQVRERIDAVEDVADALFTEWEGELKQYTNPSLRDASRRKLVATRGRYKRLLAAMRRAEAKIDPVLSVFRDQVLFLKHNLNAQAIASLRTELGNIETDVAKLIREMESSITEADSFIKALHAE